MSSAAQTIIVTARRSQEWLRSRPRLIDVLVAILIALFSLADLSGDGIAGRAREPDILAVLLIVVGATALVWRRAAPVPVMTLIVGISCVIYARDYGSFVAALGLAGVYAVAAHENNRRTAWMALGTASVVLFGVASFSVLDGVDGFRWSNALSMTLSIGAAILAGAVIRNKEEIFVDASARAERAESDRRAEAERAVARERLRIAREMHDVVAHGMSLITVQAAAAQEIARTRPEDAAQLMQSIEATGHDALADMRRMLGVLRNDDQSNGSVARGDLAPQPSLGDLDAVVAHCNEAGRPTELFIEGDQRPLPAGIELAAFRIVQEALTNVIKHGGDAAKATVTLHYGAKDLRLVVVDTGRGSVAEATSAAGGHGLIGMRERVEVYEGQLEAGPKLGGGYQVEASIPLHPVDRPSVVSADSERTGPT